MIEERTKGDSTDYHALGLEGEYDTVEFSANENDIYKITEHFSERLISMALDTPEHDYISFDGPYPKICLYCRYIYN